MRIRLSMTTVAIALFITSRIAGASSPPPVCAIVKNAQGEIQETFCERGSLGQSCSNGIACTNDTFDSAYHPGGGSGGTFPWYQEAIYWAKNNEHPTVVLTKGQLSISDAGRLPARFPHNEGVGIHVPSGVHLRGEKGWSESNLTEEQTIIRAATTSRMRALVLVSDQLLSDGNVVGAEVSHLTLIGSSAILECDSAGVTMSSIVELDQNPPLVPNIVPEEPIAEYGVLVDESSAGNQTPAGESVNVHHLVVNHVENGIAYGWNTAFQKEDDTCKTNACFSLDFHLRAGECPRGQYAMPLSLPEPHRRRPDCGPTPVEKRYCVEIVRDAECVEKNYCYNRPHEYVGRDDNWWARAKVFNNSVCNVDTGINIVGGNVDVHHNLVTRHHGIRDGFGLSPDGHWPHSSNTTFYENYVYGFDIGFLTDGSQYMAFDGHEIEQILGGRDPGCFPTWQDYLDVQQIIFDDAQKWLIGTGDWERGLVTGVTVRDNRFKGNLSDVGINLYKVNWAWVGFNSIGDPNSVENITAIGVDNTLNSWIYGNTIATDSRGIWVRGTPGIQSHHGSCFNGMGLYYDPEAISYTEYPNVYQAPTSCSAGIGPIVYENDYCREQAPIGAACFASDAAARNAGY